MRTSCTIVIEKNLALILETFIDNIFSRSTKSSTTSTLLLHKKWKRVTEKIWDSCRKPVDKILAFSFLFPLFFLLSIVNIFFGFLTLREASVTKNDRGCEGNGYIGR